MSPPIHYPSIEGLRALEATARLCSFERAADELNITSSAVSKRVLTLERLLGFALFTRRANSLVLTTEGVAYVEQAREVLRLLANMHRAVHPEKTRRIKITSTPTFARQMLVPHLPLFASAHPHIELEIVVINALLDTPATGADIEIRHGQLGPGAAPALMPDVVTPMASPLYLRTLAPLQSPADVLQLTRLNTPYDPWAPWLRAAGLDATEPQGGFRFLDLGLAYQAAASGQGVAMCRPSLVGDWLEQGALQPLFNLYAKPAGSYYVLPGAQNNSAQAFLQWIQPLCQRIAERNLRLAQSCFA